MKLNIFSILFNKAQDGLEKYISTRDKVKAIRRNYMKESDADVKSCMATIDEAKEVKREYEKVRDEFNSKSKELNDLRTKGKREEAYAAYIELQGLQNAFERMRSASEVADQNIKNADEKLNQIRLNRIMLKSRLKSIEIDISSIRMSKITSISSITNDYDTIIREIEEDLVREKEHIETENHVKAILNPTEAKRESSRLDSINESFEKFWNGK